MSRRAVKRRRRSRAGLRAEIVRLRRLILRKEQRADEEEALQPYDDLWIDLENRISMAPRD